MKAWGWVPPSAARAIEGRAGEKDVGCLFACRLQKDTRRLFLPPSLRSCGPGVAGPPTPRFLTTPRRPMNFFMDLHGTSW